MIEQVVIAVFGVASIWLSQAASIEQRKWAPVVGLVAQPFWLVATLAAEQWGIAALTVVYAFGWARGIHTYWIKGAA